MEQVSIPQELLPVELGPSLDESALRSGQTAADALNRVNGVCGGGVLVVRVKMWSMMRCSRLHKHANHDPKESRNLWHRMMISRSSGPVFDVCFSSSAIAAVPG